MMNIVKTNHPNVENQIIDHIQEHPADHAQDQGQEEGHTKGQDQGHIGGQEVDLETENQNQVKEKGHIQNQNQNQGHVQEIEKVQKIEAVNLDINQNRGQDQEVGLDHLKESL